MLTEDITVTWLSSTSAAYSRGEPIFLTSTGVTQTLNPLEEDELDGLESSTIVGKTEMSHILAAQQKRLEEGIRKSREKMEDPMVKSLNWLARAPQHFSSGSSTASETRSPTPTLRPSGTVSMEDVLQRSVSARRLRVLSAISNYPFDMSETETKLLSCVDPVVSERLRGQSEKHRSHFYSSPTSTILGTTTPRFTKASSLMKSDVLETSMEKDSGL